jgi:hypothetical protein
MISVEKEDSIRFEELSESKGMIGHQNFELIFVFSLCLLTYPEKCLFCDTILALDKTLAHDNTTRTVFRRKIVVRNSNTRLPKIHCNINQRYTEFDLM